MRVGIFSKAFLTACVLGHMALAANADVVRTATSVVPFNFPPGPLFAVPSMIAGPFPNAANERFVVTYSAECAVVAAANNSSAYIDIDIVVLNPAGAVVYTLVPTVGANDAFCSANGTAALDGLGMHAITAIANNHNLPAGNYRVQVRSRANAGATLGYLGERSLVVWR